MTSTSYEKGDVRRTLQVLAAINYLGNRATIVEIHRLTALHRRSIEHQIEHAVRTLGVTIEKDDSAYSIKDFGPLLKKTAVMLALRGKFPEGKLIDLSKGQQSAPE